MADKPSTTFFTPVESPWGDSDLSRFADYTPLHEASLHGRLLNVHQLLDRGLDANQSSADGHTPLHLACMTGHSACARALIFAGANVNQKDADGKTAMYMASEMGNVGCIRALQAVGATVKPEFGRSPLHVAASTGNRACLDELLIMPGIQNSLDLELPRLGSPLYLCCQGDHKACALSLLRAGADVSKGMGTTSPLHAAVNSCTSPSLVQLLLHFGAQARRRDTHGWDSVQLAKPGSQIHKLLTQAAEPPALVKLCFLAIRRCLGFRNLALVSQLPLPASLQDLLIL
uniref:ankyrin repeat and SOCS box protein 9-like isoform X2 n=1 Tax=Myxine glutinosa TaxID=7769 RepID=UPI00358E8DCA